MAQTKDLREKIQTLEKTAADLDARLREILAGIPNLPHASVPVGPQRRARMSKFAAGARRRSLISLPSRTGTWAPNSAFSIWNAR